MGSAQLHGLHFGDGFYPFCSQLGPSCSCLGSLHVARWMHWPVASCKPSVIYAKRQGQRVEHFEDWPLSRCSFIEPALVLVDLLCEIRHSAAVSVLLSFGPSLVNAIPNGFPRRLGWHPIRRLPASNYWGKGLGHNFPFDKFPVWEVCSALPRWITDV